MIVVPIQAWGLGDIIFEQTAVHKLAKGSPVLWPVQKSFVEGLQRAYPHISFVDADTVWIDYDRKDDYIKNNMRFIPFRWCDTNMQVPYSRCMEVKYTYFGLDYTTWKEKAMWTRYRGKEQELYDLLGCGIDGYNLVNMTFGSQSQLKVPIPIDNHMRTIEMKTIEGFSLFDWAAVIEGATTIHTVSTSIIFLLEQLDLWATEVHLYPRRPIEVDFRTIDYILERHKYVRHL